MQRGIEQHETVIRPGGNAAGYWRDLWDYRELFFFLAWRDILVRYKQTVIGVLWCVLKPVLTMIVFTVVFGKLARLPSGDLPYPVLVFAALLPWQYISGAITECSTSVISNANLLTKVYFPRLIIPASAVVATLIDFFVSFAILICLMVYYQIMPGWRLLCLPLFLALASFTSLGAGLFFAALNVKYRDFRYIVPFVTQFGLFISPVGFSSEIVPQQWRLLFSLNPAVPVIEGFRWSLAGNGAALYLPGLCIGVAAAGTLLLLGVWFFRRTESGFADDI